MLYYKNRINTTIPSIVGPRPHAVAHNEQYRQLIEGYMLRHKMKPGITGWAQINGWRGET
ncbi:putative UDP-glucose lipid carrier transferase, partial [Salmonella enterica subsp. enterica serovar Enteritidis str. 50-5646]